MKNSLLISNAVLSLFLSLLFVTTSASGQPGMAPDLEKEKRWEQQIVPQLMVGKDIHLKANGKDFLGLYTGAKTGQPRGAVILVHDGGVHPDWPMVIKPLRINLPEQGWATLSIQMPVLVSDAHEEDYVPLFKELVPARIKSAIDYLKQQNIDNIFLVGHNLGATMASDYLARTHDMRVKAFIGIGMNGMPRPGYLQLDTVFSLVQIRQPVLDIYGSKSTKGVLGSADRRIYAINVRDIEPSRQIMIQGSDHLIDSFEAQLQHEILSYMDDVNRNSRLAYKK